MIKVEAKLVPVIAAAVMVLAGMTYMLFLAYTWSQLQHDRSVRYARIDEILDRVAPVKNDAAPDGE